jgi:hypothetical protein
MSFAMRLLFRQGGHFGEAGKSTHGALYPKDSCRIRAAAGMTIFQDAFKSANDTRTRTPVVGEFRFSCGFYSRCHSREGGNPTDEPPMVWIPACVGKTANKARREFKLSHDLHSGLLA